MKAIALAAALMAGTAATAGTIVPPIGDTQVQVPPGDVVQPTTTGSNFAFIVPLVAIALIAIALSAED